MIDPFDFLMAAYTVSGGRSVAHMYRVRATVEWVCDSCACDGHPRWLTEMVVTRVLEALLRDDFPLAPVSGEET